MKKTLIILALFISSINFAQNNIQIPSTIEGTDVELILQKGTHRFYNGINTNTMGANGNILGPTLILQQGDFVNFKVVNKIDETTTIHWHGMHVSAENDGGPHTTIAPNETWNPSFKILDKAATYWYHPHLHEKTNEHVSKGIAGFIIVKDNEEANLNLPRDYGVDDFPIVIQTKDFDDNKQIVVNTNSDNIVVVNATVDPILNVPSQIVRLRLLNGSSMRVFNLGLTNNKTFYQIASDGGLLSSSVPLTRLMLAPGERAEILIDFSGILGDILELKSFASELPNGIYGAKNPGMNASMKLDGYNPNPINGTDFSVMKFKIVKSTSNPVTTIIDRLVIVNRISENNSDKAREITMSPKTMGMNQLNGEFLLNNKSFNKDYINETIPLNNTEIWTIKNNSAIAHPFHIHDVQFYILDRNGVSPELNEQGRKDVILVKPQESVRFICKFDDFYSAVPYMYHCHMLMHEDGGMMGQFKVVENLANEEKIDTNIKIYPNPSSDFIEISSVKNITNVTIYNSMGEKTYQNINVNKNNIVIKNLDSGIYIVRMQIEGQNVARKIIVD